MDHVENKKSLEERVGLAEDEGNDGQTSENQDQVKIPSAQVGLEDV